jgi:hypothetical protein
MTMEETQHEPFRKLHRRDFLVSTAAVAATTALGTPAYAATQLQYKPEAGAKLRVLRWKRFVQGDEDLWNANAKKFTELTGVEVRVDNEGWEDVRPRLPWRQRRQRPGHRAGLVRRSAAVPDKLVDVTDVATYLGNKLWRLVRRLQEIRHARQVDRGAAGRDRQCAGLSRKPDQGRRLRCHPQGHGRFPEAVPGTEGQGHARSALRSARPWAMATTGRTGCCGRTAACWSTRAARWW